MDLECRICLKTAIIESVSLLDKCELTKGIKTIEEMIFDCSAIEVNLFFIYLFYSFSLLF